MPELFITDGQDEFLEELRAEIANNVVGQYGRVRKQDALQYLIDNSLEGLDLDVEPEAVDYDPDEVEDHVEDEPSATDGGAVTDAPSGEDASADAGADATPDESDDDGSSDAGGTGGPTPSGGDDMMNTMMNLLDEHDEKWQKADTAETKYEVELPDGDTETVQTKDDVKAVLFKNY